MTKPIEGWVIINNDNNGEANRYTSEQVGGDYIEVFTSEEGALDVSGDGETVRPVRLTFTDEPNIEKDLDRAATSHANERCPGQDDLDIVWCMSKDDFLCGAKWQAEQTAGEIRKERERIWEAIKVIEDKYYDKPTPPSDWCRFHWTSFGDIRRVIFGEEK